MVPFGKHPCDVKIMECISLYSADNDVVGLVGIRTNTAEWKRYSDIRQIIVGWFEGTDWDATDPKVGLT